MNTYMMDGLNWILFGDQTFTIECLKSITDIYIHAVTQRDRKAASVKSRKAVISSRGT